LRDSALAVLSNVSLLHFLFASSSGEALLEDAIEAIVGRKELDAEQYMFFS